MQQATSALRGPYVRLRLDQFDARAAALGLATDTAIAARIGLDKATVNRVRTGEGLPGERFIAACVANLGVPFEFLFEIAEAK